ncbi:His Kinase A (phospho-acceptor) domain-containing protein [Nocardia amikacinitolerans]|nr:HAMP domain-containing sensor histidine kinase [Nocardia amikacinitolerans]MCP2317779.1 His Kinase A (phospho-acceptor) domain-containing protein [Nocardia amikacinitolerans]
MWRSPTRSFNTMLAALRFSRAQQQRLAEDAGHELRTPLTSVRGSTELLQRARGRLAPDDEAQVPATLVQEAKALDELVGELVDLATDQYATEDPEVLIPAELADECAHRFRRRTGRSITVAVENPEPVMARPRALARCVDNLIDNALKFGSVRRTPPSRSPCAQRISPCATTDPVSRRPIATPSSAASIAPTAPDPPPVPASAWPSSTTSSPPTAARSMSTTIPKAVRQWAFDCPSSANSAPDRYLDTSAGLRSVVAPEPAECAVSSDHWTPAPALSSG